MTSNEIRKAIADAEGNAETLARLVYQEHRAAREAGVLLEELRATVKSAQEQKAHAEQLLAAQAAQKEHQHVERKEQKAEEAKHTVRKNIDREIGLLCGGVWMARTLLSTFYFQLAEKLTRMGATNHAEFDALFRELTDPANFHSDKKSVAFANKIEQILRRRSKLP